MFASNRVRWPALVAIVLAAMILAGCFPPAQLAQGREHSVPQKSIEGTDWQLVTVGGAPAVPGSEATLLPSAGRVTGTTGCNRYTGSYTSQVAGVIEFGPVASTMMACPDPQMKQERAFLTALDEAAGYTISGEVLTLRGANGNELATFAPRKSIDLIGTIWSATGVNNGRQAVVSLVADSTVTAIFASDGRMSGSGGCNSYCAAYAVDGDKIKIEELVQTEMACLDQKMMAQEQAFFAALTNATTYRIDGDRLELRDDNGALQVGFRAAK